MSYKLKFSKKFKLIFKIIVINVCLFSILFLFLEIVSRLVYPEFTNNVHSPSISRGININFASDEDNIFRTRSLHKRHSQTSFGKDIIIFGDSITGGYGTAYEDIYWRKMQRMLNLSSKESYNIFTWTNYGYNSGDLSQKVKNALNTFTKKPNLIIYQFNFNDIFPFTQKDLQTGNDRTDKKFSNLLIKNTLFKNFAKFRYEHLNSSTFVRVLGNKIGIWMRSINDSCEEKNYYALGEYTWSHGSKAFNESSEKLWETFETHLKEFNKFANQLGVEFIVLVSPILFDVDPNLEQHTDTLLKDFSCATIFPRQRLQKLSQKIGFQLVDPLDYIKKGYENRLKEKNFTPFFFRRG